MKIGRTKSMFVVALILLMGYVVSCTKNDQILEVTPPVVNSSELTSILTATPPVIDGVVDPMWAFSPRLTFEAVVPDPSGDLFRSYVGQVIPYVSLRSAYDGAFVYFLAEWSDPTESLIREPWYFDPITMRWAQELGEPSFNASTGAITRGAFYEDKMAMLWNINNSVSGWNNGTCYKSCHTGLSETDGYARHHTNHATERIDMWHWKLVRTGYPADQFDDQYQDNTYPNGRLSDNKTSGGYNDNKQTLTITGTSTTVSVPKYVIPGKTDYSWILTSEITDGTAKLITAVDANGVLTYNGGTIDPVADVEFQRDGAGVGSKVIPGISTSAFVGSRGDISAKATHTGEGWILEYKRALKTADVANQDVDFSTLTDQYFGFAIFENAQIAHAIKPNLVLTFQK